MHVKLDYCSQCGGKLVAKIPEGDDRTRKCCDACGAIHYQNPKAVVGCLISKGEQVLLCRRAIEPRRDKWTIPAGFMENKETMLAGALRESWEEAEARVDDPQLYRLFDLPHISQVYVFFRGELSGDFGVGVESLETRLFSEHEIPWAELAFPVVTDLLVEYFNDRRNGEFPVRVSPPGRKWFDDLGVEMPEVMKQAPQ